MNRKTVWLLIQEGYNSNEIAAAAGIRTPAARAVMCDVLTEVHRRGRGYGMDYPGPADRLAHQPKRATS